MAPTPSPVMGEGKGFRMKAWHTIVGGLVALWATAPYLPDENERRLAEHPSLEEYLNPPSDDWRGKRKAERTTEDEAIIAALRRQAKAERAATERLYAWLHTEEAFEKSMAEPLLTGGNLCVPSLFPPARAHCLQHGAVNVSECAGAAICTIAFNAAQVIMADHENADAAMEYCIHKMMLCEEN